MLLLDVTQENSRGRECWVWFAESPFRPAGYEIAVFKEARLEVRHKGLQPEPFHTLWSDLTGSAEELLSKLSPGKRRDLGIARNRGWSIRYGNSADEIRGFHQAHTVFASTKDIGLPLAVSLLQRNADHCLVAFVNDSEQRLICWNCYLLDKPIARWWYAGSDLAHQKPSDRGYAATLLHWDMMLYLRSRGFQTYDWGGVVLDENDPAYPITRFKASFGGTHQQRFDYYCRFSPPIAQRLWRRLRCR